MSDPLLIGIAGGARDREVTSSLLRSVLDTGEPYHLAGLIGAYELYDGSKWARRPNRLLELGRIDEHLANAREAGLAYLIVELDEGVGRGVSHVDLLCAVGHGGAGTARTSSRALSFSMRGPLADIGATDVETHYGYLQLIAHTPDWATRLAIPVTGAFNLGPVLAAVAVSVLLHIDVADVAMGLLYSRAPGHGGLLVAPDRQVLALAEESRSRGDAERLVAAAREDYGAMRREVVHGADDVAAAVARAYARGEGERTLLVLLGAPFEDLEDAFQLAVRRHARIG